MPLKPGLKTESEEVGVEEELLIAFHTQDGGIDDFDARAVEFGYAVDDALNGGLTGGRVADDAAFADVASAGFELRFDEDDSVALPWVFGCAEGFEDGGQHEGR